jgi:hypothetical protein
LDDPDEKPDVNELLDWWNWSVHIWSRVPFQADALYSQVFPGYVTRARAISKTSALAKLKEKRAALKLRNAAVAA